MWIVSEFAVSVLSCMWCEIGLGMRLIDADAIVFTHAIARSIDDGHNWNELCVTKDEIDDIPSAEPERKKGTWKPDESGNVYWICSACGFASEAFGADILYHFCPNCGADMRTKGNENV